MTAAVIGIRLTWEVTVAPLTRYIPGRHSGYVRNPWRQRLVIGWSGMRGAISLAIALTLPLTEGGSELYRTGKISDEIRRAISLTLDLQDRGREA